MESRFVFFFVAQLAPENRPKPKRKGLSKHHFSGAIYVKLRGCEMNVYSSPELCALSRWVVVNIGGGSSPSLRLVKITKHL